MSDPRDGLVIPTPKFCPMCGSKNLCEKFEGWEENARKTGRAFGECAEPNCNAHFSVSTYHDFVIDDDEDVIEDEDEDDE